MNSFTEIKQKLIALKPYLAEKYKVKDIGIFGSFADGNNSPSSDIDILVDFNEPPGWEFFDLKEFLESELNCPVDLVTRNALKKQLKSRILRQSRLV